MNNYSSRKLLVPIVALYAAVLLFVSPLHAQSADMLMGNPSQATEEKADADNFLMVKKFFALSYNNSKGTPNWVSWKLVASDIAGEHRVDNFRPDPDLPGGFRRVVPSDYVNAGFDRGHMCNFADRSYRSDIGNPGDETFVMSNMVPQSPPLNEKAWESFEAYCRDLATEHKNLYIVSGPSGQGGEGRKGKAMVIGRNHVVVPSVCWKVVLVVDDTPGDDLKKVNAKTRLIAIIMPNDMTLGDEWAKFRVSVKEVEKLTGYRFFGNVPANIVEPLKEKADAEAIPKPRHR